MDAIMNFSAMQDTQVTKNDLPNVFRTEVRGDFNIDGTK